MTFYVGAVTGSLLISASLSHLLCISSPSTVGILDNVRTFVPFVPFALTRADATRHHDSFLHPHWWLDKLDMTGSSLQLVNGIFLVLSFFGARIVYGASQTIVLWNVLDDPRISDTFRWGFRLANIALNRTFRVPRHGFLQSTD